MKYAGWNITLPAGIGFISFGRNTLPVPPYHVPLMTVTQRSIV